jgi:putative oxidoreductase
MRETLLLGRIFFSLIFLVAGFGHFSDSTISYAASQGVPYAGLTVPLSGLLAIFGGLSILFGYKAKIGAWALVVFLVPVTLTMHAFWMVSDPAAAALQQAMFFKNLSMLGGALTFAYFGAGAYSVDSRMLVDQATFVGNTSAMAGTVIPTSLRTESQAEIATKVATKAGDSSRITGMW